MSYILNIETATKNCSVSLAQGGQTVLCREIAEKGYSHAERLHVFIAEILQESGVNFQELNAVAVSQGPGSYTGLRIGVSAAKGLCYSLDIPLIAIDTLQVLAAQAHIEQGLIVAMIDARRMEVYSAIFNPKIEKTREVLAQIIDENSFDTFQENLYFVGDCALKCKGTLNKSNHFFLESHIYPSANEMSCLSFKKFKTNEFVDLAYFEPYYLKDFMVTTPKKKQ